MARVFSVLPIGLLVFFLILGCHYAAAEDDDSGDSPPTDKAPAGDESPAPEEKKEGENDEKGGKCEKECPLVSEQVCGTDGVTYENNCELKNKQCKLKKLKKLSDGECDEEACKKSCDDEEEEPVCGSDGKKYENYCKFRKAHCEDKELKIEKEGDC